MKVWILTDSYEASGIDSIIGVYANETDAKLALANYVLDPDTYVSNEYIQLKSFKVEGISNEK
ncbi:MAG: hypothetical protein LOD89_05325 [Tissierellales bacterium]